MLDTMLRTTKHLIENPDEYGPIITKTETVGKLEETPDDSVVVEGWQVRNEYVRIAVSWCCISKMMWSPYLVHVLDRYNLVRIGMKW